MDNKNSIFFEADISEKEKQSLIKIGEGIYAKPITEIARDLIKR